LEREEITSVKREGRAKKKGMRHKKSSSFLKEGNCGSLVSGFKSKKTWKNIPF